MSKRVLKVVGVLLILVIAFYFLVVALLGKDTAVCYISEDSDVVVRVDPAEWLKHVDRKAMKDMGFATEIKEDALGGDTSVLKEIWDCAGLGNPLSLGIAFRSPVYGVIDVVEGGYGDVDGFVYFSLKNGHKLFKNYEALLACDSENKLALPPAVETDYGYLISDSEITIGWNKKVLIFSSPEFTSRSIRMEDELERRLAKKPKRCIKKAKDYKKFARASREVGVFVSGENLNKVLAELPEFEELSQLVDYSSYTLGIHFDVEKDRFDLRTKAYSYPEEYAYLKKLYGKGGVSKSSVDNVAGNGNPDMAMGIHLQLDKIDEVLKEAQKSMDKVTDAMGEDRINLMTTKKQLNLAMRALLGISIDEIIETVDGDMVFALHDVTLDDYEDLDYVGGSLFIGTHNDALWEAMPRLIEHPSVTFDGNSATLSPDALGLPYAVANLSLVQTSEGLAAFLGDADIKTYEEEEKWDEPMRKEVASLLTDYTFGGYLNLKADWIKRLYETEPELEESKLFMRLMDYVAFYADIDKDEAVYSLYFTESDDQALMRLFKAGEETYKYNQELYR